LITGKNSLLDILNANEINFRNKKEQIKVSVRMRPLLSPYENDNIWHVDQNSKMIYTDLSKTVFESGA
jgi:hypothetical protein